MNASEIRKSFLDFFQSKQHLIVPSAPMVVKNDPTLMFTNAGMNQFKEIFLGNAPRKSPRIADSQKCLRVSGKHNDLEEVGLDTYHHTMFEMLGNWSFGDYFKKEAIDWAWEYLTEVLKIDKNNLYVTVFEGDKKDGTEFDQEAYDIWKSHVSPDRILNGNKHDNFWEMGEVGPCGPCSEIHVDIRSDEEKAKIPGRELVNKDNPQVIEIWNLVFMQYNRKANGELEFLPAKHIDTGMGFERLCMVVQGKRSNYDTDVFQNIIGKIGEISGKKYGENAKADIAMRVIADHVRTIAFAITDGQLPSNNKAGYVIRRILRRAVRYGYTFLGQNDPFLYRLLPVLIETMGEAYPELNQQKDLIEKVIKEEESSFLRTLENGIKLLEKEIEKAKSEGRSEIDGKQAFILYDTYGFPFDLTQLILRENNFTVNEDEFQKELNIQKDRSRSATQIKTDDWVVVNDDEDTTEFIGYDYLESKVKILKYRKVNAKGKDMFQIVFDRTPFYAEMGGQVGDKGYIEANGERVAIDDTKKENGSIVHITSKVPTNVNAEFNAVVNAEARIRTSSNHSATHLLHYALQQVLGSHVEQKGSSVDPDRLRFDFSHFQKMTDEEIAKAEEIVNKMIRENIALVERRSVPIAEARAMGAKALFGEKYGDFVRMIQYGPSMELCGGTHIASTGNIGFFKIMSESAIAAGVRRIEAITNVKAAEYVNSQLNKLKELSAMLKNPADLLKSVELLINENSKLSKQLEGFEKAQIKTLAQDLKAKSSSINGINFVGEIVEISNANALKDIAFMLKDEVANSVIALAANIDGKANLVIGISKDLVENKKLNAGQIIREAAKEIQGGGGGQPFIATAGGKNCDGLMAAINKVKQSI